MVVTNIKRDYITLDIDDIEGTLDGVKYLGTIEEFIKEFETRTLVKVEYNYTILYLNTNYIQRFSVIK